MPPMPAMSSNARGDPVQVSNAIERHNKHAAIITSLMHQYTQIAANRYVDLRSAAYITEILMSLSIVSLAHSLYCIYTTERLFA